MEELRSKLLRLSKDACRLLLSGAVTLLAALGLHSAPEPSPDYVEAILVEVSHMPEDLRARFVEGTVTMTDVREEVLRRHVAARRLPEDTARLFSDCAIDLGTIAASVAQAVLSA